MSILTIGKINLWRLQVMMETCNAITENRDVYIIDKYFLFYVLPKLEH